MDTPKIGQPLNNGQTVHPLPMLLSIHFYLQRRDNLGTLFTPYLYSIHTFLPPKKGQLLYLQRRDNLGTLFTPYLYSIHTFLPPKKGQLLYLQRRDNLGTLFTPYLYSIHTFLPPKKGQLLYLQRRDNLGTLFTPYLYIINTFLPPKEGTTSEVPLYVDLLYCVVHTARDRSLQSWRACTLSHLGELEYSWPPGLYGHSSWGSHDQSHDQPHDIR